MDYFELLHHSQFKFPSPTKVTEKDWSRLAEEFLEKFRLSTQVGRQMKHTKQQVNLMLKLIDKTQSKEWTYLEKALHVLKDVDPTVAEVCLLGDLSGGAPPNLLLQIEWSLLLSVPFNLQIPVTQKYIKNLTTVYSKKFF